MKLKEKLGIILLIALLTFFPTRANAATVSDMAKQLSCQCGCFSVLSNCAHGECVVQGTMSSQIEQKLAQGQSEAQIIQFFVAKYGEQVLAAPPKQGFTLMAWVAPFAALLLGAGIIYILLKKWIKQGKHHQVDTMVEVDEKDKKYQHQLEEELEEFARRNYI